MAAEEGIGVEGLLSLDLDVLDEDIALTCLNDNAFMLDNIYDFS